MSSIRILFVLSLLCLFPGLMTAQTGYDIYLKQSGIGIAPGNVMDLKDPLWDIMVNDPQSSWDFTNQSTRAKIIFSTDLDILQPQHDYTAKVTFDVTHWFWDESLPTPGPNQQTQLRSMQIEYKKDGRQSFDPSAFTLIEGAYALEVELLGFEIDQQAVNPPPDYFSLELIIMPERIFDFDRTAVPLVNGISPSLLNGNGHIMFDWNVVDGAEYYEIEYTTVSPYDLPDATGTPQYLDPNTLEYDFRRDATRVQVAPTETQYRINGVFPRTHLIIRVRAMGKDVDFPDQIQDGAWSLPAQGIVGTLPATATLELDTPHEGNALWIYSAVRGEDGLRSESVAYMDQSGRSRQAVSLSHSKAIPYAISQETIYDAEGRPAIATLPTPQQDEHLKLFLNQNMEDGSNTPYSWQTFDQDQVGTNCIAQMPPAMSNTAGANQYYSSNNPDKNLQQKYLPDAENYAFSFQKYYPDPRGKVIRQGGPGPDMTVGSGNEVQYFESDVPQVELDALFHGEVGEASHYTKEGILDQNGQLSVSYKNQTGQTIATILGGTAKATPLLPLPSNTGPTSLQVPLEDHNVRDDNIDAYVITYQHLQTATGPCTLNYHVDLPGLEKDCQKLGTTLCYDCIYELSISVKNDCQEEMLIGGIYSEELGPIGSLDDACTTGQLHDVSLITEDMPIGSYTITKTLKVHQPSLEGYHELFMNATGCFLPPEQFIDSLIELIDFSSCEGDYCDLECVAQIGTLEEWMAEDPTNNTDPEAYQEIIDECVAACNQSTWCDGQYYALLGDMAPGGQYALYDILPDGSYDASAYPYSILNDANTYYGAHFGNISYGSFTPPTDLDDFIDQFEDEWGEYLISYHPKYCMLTWCESNIESHLFDQEMLQMLSYDDAEIGGLVPNISTWPNPLSLTNDIFDFANQDPFFDPATGSGDLSTFTSYADDFMGTGLSIWEISLALSACESATDYAGCIVELQNNPPDPNCIKDRLWTIYRALYLSTKYKVQKEEREALPCHNENPPGKVNPFPEIDDLIGIDMSQSPQDIFNDALAMVTPGLADHCQQVADNYAPYWTQKLEDCSFSASDLALIIQAFKDITIDGCDGSDGQHPMGASTIANGGSIMVTGPAGQVAVSSFDDVLALFGVDSNPLINGSQNPAFDPYCNALLIEMPRPYETSLSGGPQTFPLLDGCACENLLELRDEFVNNPPPDLPAGIENVSQYFDYIHGFPLPNVSELICDCEDSYQQAFGTSWPMAGHDWSQVEATLADLMQPVPANIACQSCIACPDIEQAFTDYADILQYPNSDVLFASYMNQQLGFNLSFWQYQDFYDECQANAPGGCDYELALDDLSAFLQDLINNGELTAQNVDLTGYSSYINSYLYTDVAQTCLPEMDATLIFSRLFDAEIISFNPTVNHELILVGKNSSDALIVAKLYADDTWAWTQTFNMNDHDFDWSTLQVIPTLDGGALVGSIIQTSTGGKNLSLLKVNNLGALEWSRIYDDSGDPRYLAGMVQQSDGKFIIGYVQQANPNDYLYTTVLLHLNTQGYIHGNGQVQMDDIGSSFYNESEYRAASRQLVPAPNDGAYLAGFSEDEEYLTVYRIDNQLGKDWARYFPAFKSFCAGNHISLTTMPNGDLGVLVGHNAAGEPEAYILEITQGGNPSWDQSIDIADGLDFKPHSLDATSDNGLLVGGEINGNRSALIKFNTNGLMEWTAQGTNPSQQKVLARQKQSDYFVMLEQDDQAQSRLSSFFLKDNVLYASCDINPFAVNQPNSPIQQNNYTQHFTSQPSLSVFGPTYTTGTMTLRYQEGCGEKLYLAFTDNCELDCEVWLNLPALPGATATALTTTDNISGGAYSQNSIDLSGTYLDDQLNISPIDMTGSNDCLGYCSESMVLCNESIFVEIPIDETACEDHLIEVATHEALELYEEYLAELSAQFKADYRNRCLDQNALNESLELDHPFQANHATLYVYNLVGELIETVPPEGVEMGFDQQYHKQSQYHTNSFGNRIHQFTPDGDESWFAYNELGQMVFSQNKKQEQEGFLSYMLRDGIDRIIEVGEIQYSGDPFSSAVLVHHGFMTQAEIDDIWNSNPAKREVTYTFYDRPVPAPYAPADLSDAMGGDPENLRGRVAGIFFDHVTDPNRNHGIYYSYDELGNVHTQVSYTPMLEVLEQDMKVTTYDYELISGRVKQVHYQVGHGDEFHQAYTYDDDGRIKTALASRDGCNWTQHGHYDYYDNGFLARVEMGKVQGMDYATTASGWIKAINGNSLNPHQDMGRDGYTGGAFPYDNSDPDIHASFPADVWGSSLMYFENDYTPIQILPQSDHFLASNEYVYDASGLGLEGLHNGNIHGIARTMTEQDGSKTANFISYSYDQLNRLRAAQEYWDDDGFFINNNLDNLTQVEDYYSAYSYSADGKLESLTRNGGSNPNSNMTPMDEFTYEYGQRDLVVPGTGTVSIPTNRLDHVSDAITNSLHDNDIESQDPNNYNYDEIGNLTGDISEEIELISWNSNGKISDLYRTDPSDRMDMGFHYDALQNRHSKVIMRNRLDESTWTYDIQERDVSGNVLAAYRMYYESQDADITPFEDFTNGTMIPLNGNDASDMSVLTDGTEVRMDGHGFKLFQTNGNPYSITSNTVIEFEFKAAELGKRSGIGFDNGPPGLNKSKVFVVGGTQAGTAGYNTNYFTYDTPGAWKKFTIPVGSYYTGNYGYMAFVSIKKGSGEPMPDVHFRNIKIYEEDGNTDDYNQVYELTSFPIYGANRLGMIKDRTELARLQFNGSSFTASGYFSNKDIIGLKSWTAPDADAVMPLSTGNTHYEITDHLGNVVSTVSDRKLQIVDSGTGDLDGYQADLIGSTAYYPFGAQKEGVGFDGDYRFGFNGKEMDNEMNGGGNIYDYGFRIYNPDVATFLSVDPLAANYPFYSPYPFAGNKPTAGIDVDGLEELIVVYSQTAREAILKYKDAGDIVSLMLASIAMTREQFDDTWHIDHYDKITKELGWPEGNVAASYTVLDPDVQLLFIAVANPDGTLSIVHKELTYVSDFSEAEMEDWIDVLDKLKEYNHDSDPSNFLKWIIKNGDHPTIRDMIEGFIGNRALEHLPVKNTVEGVLPEDNDGQGKKPSVFPDNFLPEPAPIPQVVSRTPTIKKLGTVYKSRDHMHWTEMRYRIDTIVRYDNGFEERIEGTTIYEGDTYDARDRLRNQ